MKKDPVIFWKSLFPISYAISHYLEAKFDYEYFILLYSFRSHDATQKISGNFDQKWWHFFVISLFHNIYKNIIFSFLIWCISYLILSYLIYSISYLIFHISYIILSYLLYPITYLMYNFLLSYTLIALILYHVSHF